MVAKKRMTETGTRPTEREVFDAVMAWKAKRRPPVNPDHVALTVRQLAVMGWINVDPSNDLPVRDPLALTRDRRLAADALKAATVTATMSPAGSKNAPEAKAREKIDGLLEQPGWVVQDRDDMNLAGGDGIAVREFKLDRVTAMPTTCSSSTARPSASWRPSPRADPHERRAPGQEVRRRAARTARRRRTNRSPSPTSPPARRRSSSTCFDPNPRSRPIFMFHRPETLREWLTADTLDAWVKRSRRHLHRADDTKPSTLAGAPASDAPGRAAWHVAQQGAGRRRTSRRACSTTGRARSSRWPPGTGKTFLAVTTLYRLIKFGGARRVLFLVDRANLGEQAEKEFQGFRTPDDNRKFTELYNVQRLTSNTIGASSKVVITTIQRLYSMLKGEPDLDPEVEEQHASSTTTRRSPRSRSRSSTTRRIPPEFFDVIFIDECHRSIYSLWRQVLEYFDAYLLGLTATPAKHTFGFFNQNVVMEYPHEQAVADGVNVRLRRLQDPHRDHRAGLDHRGGPGTCLRLPRPRDARRRGGRRPTRTSATAASDLDRNVVADRPDPPDRPDLPRPGPAGDLPGRTEVPKTLIFAKDDSARRGHRARSSARSSARATTSARRSPTRSTGRSPQDLIQSSATATTRASPSPWT